MSGKSLPTTRGSVLSSPRTEEVRGESVELLASQRIATKEDVIRTFFNLIVEHVIEDMVVIQPKEKVHREASNGSQVVVKNFKDLDKEDLKNFEITAAKGSKISLKRNTSQLSAKRSKHGSGLSVIQENTSDKRSSTTSSSISENFLNETRAVRITFTTGNTYEGQFSKRVMNGKGIYRWTDGTVYEGDFFDGFPTGQGEMILPDLSRYAGSFNQGLFDGEGFLNIVSTPSLYSGQWKHGRKHGKGWMLYEPNDWYEGEWRNDLKDGFGVRHFRNGAKYRGTWREGLFEGKGTMIWENNDYYKGDWSGGTMHGEGEYIWKAFFNDTFSFPAQNVFRGSWSRGKRYGEGVMYFGGDSGARLKSTWYQDFKHGDGYMICGNGTVVNQPNLFVYDKPLAESPCFSNACKSQISELPIFAVAEDVDVGHYIDKVLEKLKRVDPGTLVMLKAFEAKCIKKTIIHFLPQLNDLYKDYAALCAKKELHHRAILVRMFLWQLYRDVEIFSYGLSLVDTDKILAQNPKSALDTVHCPFEPIYFWQFLMSLIGVGLMSCSLDRELEGSVTGGVCAWVIERFFQETIFRKLIKKSSLAISYVDLVPVKSVYSLYRKLGEPHTIKTFLRHSCVRKGEVPLLCHLELLNRRNESIIGENLIPLANYVTFMKNKGKDNTEAYLSEEASHNWTSLFDLRHLGTKNVLRCLSEVCPSIVEEGIIVNIDYSLTFLEFYEVLLSCIFRIIDLELKKEKKIIEETQIIAVTQERKKSKGKTSVRSEESRKSVSKKEKTGIHSKKKLTA